MSVVIDSYAQNYRSMAQNDNLKQAKKAKNDEFYTQWADIEKEIMAYLENLKQEVLLGQEYMEQAMVMRN